MKNYVFIALLFVINGCSTHLNEKANWESVSKQYCNQGNAEECFLLGMTYYSRKNIKEAKEMYDKACNGGYTDGCNNLGLMYEKGEGVERDVSKAVELYMKTCNDSKARSQGMSCNNLGLMYEKGKGIKQDSWKAAIAYDRACNLGYAIGCSNLKDIKNQ